MSFIHTYTIIHPFTEAFTHTHKNFNLLNTIFGYKDILGIPNELLTIKPINALCFDLENVSVGNKDRIGVLFNL